MFKILSTCRGGGYRYCRTDPPHPRRNAKGLYPLHRVIVENELGRLLLRTEDVHHIDGDKSNDAPENLIALANSKHVALHHTVKPEMLVCPVCGGVFALKPNRARIRRSRSKSGKVFCSGRCAGRRL